MKNRFGTDLTSLRNLIMDNKDSVASKAIAQALRSNLSAVEITGLERWNYPTKENKWGAIDEGPKADGFYDVEGHAWTDINGYLTLSLLNKDDRRLWLSDVKEFFSEIYEDTAKNFKHFVKAPKAYFEFVYTYAKTLSLKRSYWIWTVESFSTLVSDMAEERLEATLGDHKAVMSLIKTDIKKYNEMLSDIRNNISTAEIRVYAQSDYVRINDWMWVQKNDPTIILVDQTLHPYDLKSGWSNSAIAVILKIWYWYLFDQRVQVKELDETSYNKLSKDLKRGMLDFKTGNTVKLDLDKLSDGNEPSDG